MNEEPGLFNLGNHIGNTDDFKGNIEATIPGKSVNFESAVTDVFSKRQPARCDAMFLYSDKAIYVEFKTYTDNMQKNKDINYKICDKIACTALMHHRFLKGTQIYPKLPNSG